MEREFCEDDLTLQGIESPWLDDWQAEESPEPSPEEELRDDLVSFSSISRYDDIGKSATATTIRDELKGKSISRSLFMTVLHNSATPSSADKGLATVKSFANYHMNVRGWKAIGYHFVIDKNGVIWFGRKLSVIGSHAGPNGNPGSVGVCLIGNFETTDKPTEAQKNALAALHNALYDLFYGNVKNRIRFHREFMSTGCPGKITQDEVMGWVNAASKPDKPSETTSIFLDGQQIGTAVILNGTSYTALRKTFEAAGFKVDWDAKRFVANMTSPGKQPIIVNVSGTREKPKITVDGKVSGVGTLIGGSTYAPVRSTFEAAGYDVEWKESGILVKKMV